MSGNNEEHLDIDPCEIVETETQKVASMEDQYKRTFDDMNAKIALLELEKQAAVAVGVRTLPQLAEAGASAVTPGSGKKVNWTSTHQARHDEVVPYCTCAPRAQEPAEQKAEELSRHHLVVCQAHRGA
jgi:hypothetical protein